MDTQEVAGAWKLVGRTLASGWKVTEALGWDPTTGAVLAAYTGTGGNFSVTYRAEKEGKKAFLKAIDLTRPMKEPDPMAALHRVTSEHQFEVKILELCSGARLDRIVVALDSGSEKLSNALNDLVPYLVFELAEGDVRKRLRKIDANVRMSWWLRAIHHAAVGLNQLHSKRITHQDIKPSNILSFGSDQGFKLADLGRSTCEDVAGPLDKFSFTGDPSYAPLEILYGTVNPDAFQRRMACDCYMLGSMIFFFGHGFGATQLFLNRLPVENRPYPSGSWLGSYGEMLPMLQNEFTGMLADLSKSLGEGEVANDLVRFASELCSPDPKLRGHPLEHAHGSNIYSLQRYISVFDRLARASEVEARKAVAT